MEVEGGEKKKNPSAYNQCSNDIFRTKRKAVIEARERTKLQKMHHDEFDDISQLMYAEAIQSEDWRKEIEEEYNSHFDSKTWILVPAPPGRKNLEAQMGVQIKKKNYSRKIDTS